MGIDLYFQVYNAETGKYEHPSDAVIEQIADILSGQKTDYQAWKRVYGNLKSDDVYDAWDGLAEVRHANCGFNCFNGRNLL